MAQTFFAPLLIASFVLLMAIGTPIGVTLIAVALGGMLIFGGPLFAWSMLESFPYSEASSYDFVVVPMFLLMGTVAAKTDIVKELYDSAFKWLSGVRGSVFVATTVTSTGFAALSGSTIVNAAVFTRIALPEMLRLGFDKRFGAGCIAAAGTIAALIPPSLVMVIYGTVTDTSIGGLLVAGIVPGLLTAAVYCAGIVLIAMAWPRLSPAVDMRFSWGQRLLSLKGIWPLALLVFILLYGIYDGIMPPTAAGAVGAMGTIALGFARRKLTLRVLWHCLNETARMTASLFLVILGGLMFSRMLLITGLIDAVINGIEKLGIGPTMLIVILVIFYLILGMLVDAISMMVMTLPFVFPLVMSSGYDPIWFGIIIVKLAELGAITPPVGINLFAVVAAGGGTVTLGDVIKGIWPFVLMELAILTLLIAFPQISLALKP